MKKVVLIDDDYGIREGIKTLISAWSKEVAEKYEVYSSENGVEGLGYVYLVSPEVVIIDTTLPKYSGRELIEYLKSNKSLIEKGTKVVVLTEEESTLDRPTHLIELPSNFITISKRDAIFEEKLKESLEIYGVELGTLERIVNSLVRIGNQNDILLRKISRTNIFLKLPLYIVWFIYQVEMSLILFSLRLFRGRTKDSNIKQEKKDLTSYRVRYYPTLVTVITSLLFILLQVTLFITGGLVVLNTRVESIFAIGEGEQTLTFNTTTQEDYTYNDEQVSFTTEGVSLELVQLTEGTPGQEGQEEVVDPETGEIIQEATEAVEEVSPTYEYKIEGEGILTTTNPIEYSELIGFTETSTVVDAEGNVVEDATSTSIGYQISKNRTEWYYYDTTNNEEGNPLGWSLGGQVLTETNTAEEINDNITTFAEAEGSGNLYIKVYLSSSDNNYSPRLTSITVETDKAVLTPITTQDEIVVPNAPDPGLSEYYVDGVGGDDNNSGTSSLPLKTIQAAADVADAGDTIYVKGGISYSDIGSTTCGISNNRTVVACLDTNSGTSGNPITFTSWPGTGIPVVSLQGHHDGLNITGQDYITISNFKIDNTNGLATNTGIFAALSSNVIYSNNVVIIGSDTLVGLMLGFSMADSEASNNTLYSPSEDIYAIGINAANGVTNINMMNNIVVGLTGPALNANDSAAGTQVTADYNLLWDNTDDFSSNITPGANNITGQDPLFVDEAGGDFTLQSTSPAIDAGADLTGTVDTDIRGLLRPNAGGYDIGAYEDGNLYVAGDTGDDATGDGSASNPWQTIQKAANESDTGDTINVKGGLTYASTSGAYACTMGSGGDRAVFCETTNGSASYPITYIAWNGTGIPVIDGGVASVNANMAIGIQSNYVYLSGFKVINGGTNIIFGNSGGIRTLYGTNNHVFTNNIIENTDNTIVALQTGDLFYNNTLVGNSGIVHINGTGVQFRNNIITGNDSFWGYIFYCQTSSSQFDSNIVYNNSDTLQDGCTNSINPITEDPQFIDEAGGDYRLMGNSPGIDAGIDVTSTIMTDIRGYSRLLEGGVDIGAYENITDYYVAGDTGNDSNLGTESAPFKTIQAAADVLLPGGTVNIKGGLTYSDTGDADCDGFGDSVNFCPRNNGVAGNMITYKGWEGTGIPVIDASGKGYGTYLIGDAYTRLEGMRFTGDSDWAAIWLDLDVTNVEVVNNVIDNSSMDGIHLYYADYIKIISNTIYNTRQAVIIDGDATEESLYFRNNVVFGNKYGIATNYGQYVNLDISDYNIAWNNINLSGGTRNFYQVTKGVNDLEIDPQIVDAAGGDFRLMGNSPAIDSGLNVTSTITTDILGNPRLLEGGVDRGAYENITQYYVAGDTGNDSNLGIETAPLKTIQAAADVILPGKTINVKGGVVYNDANDCTIGLGIEFATVCISTSGTSDNYITLKSWPGTGRPIIDAANVNQGIRLDKDFVRAMYYIIEGFEVRNAGRDIGVGNNKHGISINHNAIVRNNLLVNNTDAGIATFTTTSLNNVKIYNNTVIGGEYSGIGALTYEGNETYIKNNIVTGSAVGIHTWNVGEFYNDYNLLYNNTENFISGVNAGENSILDQDPLFVDSAGGDYRLAQGSPGVDAGDDSVLSEVITDIAGLARPQGEGIDIGAYEYDDNEIEEVVITRIGTIENIVNITPVLYYYTEEEMEVEGRGEVGATVYFENKTTGETFTTIVDENGIFTITLSNERGTNEYEYYQEDIYDNKSATKELTLVIGIENFPDWLREEDQDNQDGEGRIEEGDTEVEDLLVETEEEKEGIDKLTQSALASTPLIAALSLITVTMVALSLTGTTLNNTIGVLIGWLLNMKKKYWGIVYDKNYSSPIPFALVRLYKKETKEGQGKLIGTTVTDMEGRYGFKVGSVGEYTLEVVTSGYNKYANTIKVGETREMIEDIGLEREGETKEERKVFKQIANNLRYRRRELLKYINIVLLIVTLTGLVYSIAITPKNTTVLNVGLVVTYVVITILNIVLAYKLLIPRKVAGRLLDKETKQPMKNKVVRFYKDKEQISLTLTNEKGELKVQIPEGEYEVYVAKDEDTGSRQFQKVKVQASGVIEGDVVI